MRKYQNTLLTTAAAVALIVGAGLASAQEHSQSHSPGATQSSPMGQHPGGTPGAAEQRPSSSAQQQPSNNPATAQEQERRGGPGAQQKPSNTPATAQEQERRGGPGAQQKPSNTPATAQEQEPRNRMSGKQRPSSNPASAEEQRRNGTSAQRQTPNAPSTAEQKPSRGGPNTAQGRNGLNGLQGSASGTNVQLSEQQRTEFRRTIIDARGAPKVGHVDFDIAVGTAVPRDRIHLVPVPETLVQIEPRWSGFLYFVYTDEIVVVNPNDMRIVAVLMV
jgi:hypothetical protein